VLFDFNNLIQFLCVVLFKVILCFNTVLLEKANNLVWNKEGVILFTFIKMQLKHMRTLLEPQV